MENHSTIKPLRADPTAGDTKQGYCLLQKDALLCGVSSPRLTLCWTNQIMLRGRVMQWDDDTTQQTHQPTNPEGHGAD